MIPDYGITLQWQPAPHIGGADINGLSWHVKFLFDFITCVSYFSSLCKRPQESSKRLRNTRLRMT